MIPSNRPIIMIVSPSLLLPSELFEICTNKNKAELYHKYGSLTVTMVQSKIGGIFDDITEYLDNVVDMEAKFQSKLMRPFKVPVARVVRYAEVLTQQQHQCWRN